MNSQQFKEQILPMYKQMLAVAARMFDGDMDTAADAVQDTIAKLWERRKEIEISQSPNALCIAAVRNRCISIIRSRHIDLAVNTEMPDIPDGASADANSDAERVRMVINILGEPQRTILKMSMRGFSNSEIASEQRITEVNARQILSRGRRQLREILSKI